MNGQPPFLFSFFHYTWLRFCDAISFFYALSHFAFAMPLSWHRVLLLLAWPKSNQPKVI